MLESLHVKNVALIDESHVTFGKGLNILTGETGAGKSMIIGSINLALGGKGDKSLIRAGAEYALVQLMLKIEDEDAIARLKELDVYPDEENGLLLERRITATKSISKINGELIANKTLKDVAEIIIDIHGQHEHQSLLKKSNHFKILDEYCGEMLKEMKPKLSVSYKNLKDLEKELELLREQGENREKELAFAKYELDEIESAKLVSGEDEELEALNRKMTNAQKIAGALYIADEAIQGQGENASSFVERAFREVKAVSAYDDSLQDLCEQFETLEDILNSIGHTIRNCEGEMEFDEAQFREVEQRLDLINQLKNKYAKKTGTIDEILKRQEELEKEVEKLQDFEGFLNKKEEEYKNEQKHFKTLCEQVSIIRKKQATKLADSMQCALEDLNFLQVCFEISVQSGTEYISKEGFDDVEFLISLNPGEELKPLHAVASGGELSRVMLALKTVLADRDKIDTLIFDEIDAGISGKTAWKVSEKMAVLGKDHQVICITHLPQIAAMADEHFVIEKESQGEATRTRIRSLEREEMIREIARLLGSDTLTETVLQSAEELKIMADQTKVY